MDYSDSDIRTWAEQIREIKIRELKDLIQSTKSELGKCNGLTSIRLKTKAKVLEEKLEYLILSA